MANDYSKPNTSTSTKTSALGEIRGIVQAALSLDPHLDSNIPAGALYFNRTSRNLQEYNGSAFVDAALLSGVPTYPTSTGSAGTYTLTNPNKLTGYVNGQIITFVADKNSAGSDVLNMGAFGNMNICKQNYSGYSLLEAFDITINQVVTVVVIGATNCILLTPNPFVALKTWGPAYSCSGSMTFSTTPTTNWAEFLRGPNYIDIDLSFTGTLVAPVSSRVSFTLPVTPSRDSDVCFGWGGSSATAMISSFVHSTNRADITLQSGSNFNAAVYNFIVQGRYRWN